MKRKFDSTLSEITKSHTVDVGDFNRIGMDITKSVIRWMFDLNYYERHKIPQICKTFKEYYDKLESECVMHFVENNWPLAISILFLNVIPEGTLEFYQENMESQIDIQYDEDVQSYEVYFCGGGWGPEMQIWEPDDYEGGTKGCVTKKAVLRKLKDIAKKSTKLCFLRNDDRRYNECPYDNLVWDYEDILNPTLQCYAFAFDEYKPIIFPKHKDLLLQEIRWTNRYYQIFWW